MLAFRGWKPGGAEGGLSAFGWFCCVAGVGFTFLYYLVVSILEWSNWLLWVGIAVHLVGALGFLCIISQSDGGFILAPVMFAGFGCWFAYLNSVPSRRIVT